MKIEGANLAEELRLLRGVEPIAPRSNGIRGLDEQGDAGGKTSFVDFLSQSFEKANQLGIDADKKIEAATLDENINPHEALIAVQKADVSFRLMLAVKEQLEQAYQQIMRTSIG